MEQQIRDTLVEYDGIRNAFAIRAEHVGESLSNHPLLAAIRLARCLDDKAKTISIVVSGDVKIVVFLFRRYHVAVSMIPSHPINKSFQRIMRQVGRRFCGSALHHAGREVPDGVELR